MEAAEDLSGTYSRMLRETADGVERLVDQTTTALSPVHQTRAHPWTMMGAALGVGFAIGRLHARARPFTSAVSSAPPLQRRRP
jgi:ElaB/YqjD/DUF883 family membrane-anchored ribosome-binding protein